MLSILTNHEECNMFLTKGHNDITLRRAKMNNPIWALLPMVFVVIMYVFLLARKGEPERIKSNLRSNDWVTYMAAIFGGVVMASSMEAVGIWQRIQTIWTGICFAMVAGFILILVLRVRSGKPIVQPLGDERMAVINAKSARNALFATYLVFLFTVLLQMQIRWMRPGCL